MRLPRGCRWATRSPRSTPSARAASSIRAPTGSCWPCRRPPMSSRPKTCCRHARNDCPWPDLPMILSANDRAALSDLAHRYAANVDDRQFDAAAQLFTATAELTVPEPPAALEPIRSHRGQEAIAAAVAAVAAVTRTEHAIVGEVYD